MKKQMINQTHAEQRPVKINLVYLILLQWIGFAIVGYLEFQPVPRNHKIDIVDIHKEDVNSTNSYTASLTYLAP
jgi:hypothetical protein